MAVCAFCGPTKAPISEEDIWPRWFSRLHKRTANPKTFVQMYYDGRRGRVEVRRGQAMRTTCDVVCRTCNNEWMSQLEDEARKVLTPIILQPDAARQLDDIQQMTIALWLTMKAIVLDHYAVKRQGHKPFFSPRHRQNIREAEIPDRVSVWMALLPVRMNVPVGNIIPTYLGFADDPERRHLHAYTFTYSLVRLSLQMLAVKDIAEPAPGAADSLPFTVLPSRGTWSEFAPLLWPIGRNVVSWPPARRLRFFRESAYDAFANRFKPYPFG